MVRPHRALRLLVPGRLHPGHCSICGLTLFGVRGPWLPNDYLCIRCRSAPRERALYSALEALRPNWRDLTIFEPSAAGAASDLIGRECPYYTPSHFYADQPPGSIIDGTRCEDLRALTLADSSVDIVITQQVLEHVVNPDLAFREIARVLRPGGLHLFTVPLYQRTTTVVRVADSGEHLMPPDYHGNPIDDGRALVVREWGLDLPEHVRRTTGMTTEQIVRRSGWRGLRGEMLEVLVSRKAD